MIFNIECNKNKTALVDADSAVYRIGGAIDMLGAGQQLCEKMIENFVESIYDNTGCSKAIFYLGAHTNYRNEVATLVPYKGNRTGSARPEYYDAIRAYFINNHAAVLVDEQEAEDEVGIQSYARLHYRDFIICAIDKDLDMLAGDHYNYVTKKAVFVDKVEALRRFYAQLVTGDSTDNIPGLYKVLCMDGREDDRHQFRYSRYKSKLIAQLAEVKTEREMYKIAKSYYAKYDLAQTALITEIGQLLWIRRRREEMWVPPCSRDYDYITNDIRSR